LQRDQRRLAWETRRRPPKIMGLLKRVSTVISARVYALSFIMMVVTENINV
jgi:hypothetical protein